MNEFDPRATREYIRILALNKVMTQAIIKPFQPSSDWDKSYTVASDFRGYDPNIQRTIRYFSRTPQLTAPPVDDAMKFLKERLGYELSAYIMMASYSISIPSDNSFMVGSRWSRADGILIQKPLFNIHFDETSRGLLIYEKGGSEIGAYSMKIWERLEGDMRVFTMEYLADLYHNPEISYFFVPADGSHNDILITAWKDGIQ